MTSELIIIHGAIVRISSVLIESKNHKKTDESSEKKWKITTI